MLVFFYLVFYSLSLTFWLILLTTFFREAIIAAREVSEWKECSIILSHLLCKVFACRLVYCAKYNWVFTTMQTESSIETKMEVGLSKVLLQWQLHTTHALILIWTYMLYIIALFIHVLQEYLSIWVSLSTVLVYKRVFLKAIVGKVLFAWPLVQCCSRWDTALISSLLPFLWIPLCVWNIFQTHNPITPFHKYQPESLQLFNITTSAFRQPVFVYRSEKCMCSRLRLVRWIWIHVSFPLYFCRHICKHILYNSYRVFCTRNKWIHHECAVSFAYSFKN